MPGGMARGRSRIAVVGIAAVAATLGGLSSNAGAGSTGPDDAEAPTISANGRFVAFNTGADFGGPVSPGASNNVYVYDRKLDKFELISRRSKSQGGGGADGFSYSAKITPNGRFVMFSSTATNLSGAATAEENAYVYDRKLNKVELVSRRSKADGGAGQDDTSGPYISISANGRFAGFDTYADNLGGPIDPAASTNVYVYDRKLDRVQLVSRQSKAAGGDGANNASQSPSLSASGRWVAFGSAASNLGPDPTSTGTVDVFVYDRKSKRVELVSRRSHNGPVGDESSSIPSISATGRYVAFESGADNLGGPVETDYSNVYVYDRERKVQQLVSRRSKSAGGAGGDEDSFAGLVSANGCCVIFLTQAANLGGPAAPAQNTYVYVRKSKRVELVSRRSNGGNGANDFSAQASISKSGRFAVFHTGATNLGGGPRLSANNVYVYDRDADRVNLVSGLP